MRVIAATNRDLEAAVADGTFRSDLFYRLNVFPIEIPPLRERREDIPLLVEYFINRYARKVGRTIRRMNKRSLELLQAYPWPGNIRELQNVIERSVIVCESENFSVDESWLSRQPQAAESKAKAELSQKVAAQEKEMIESRLEGERRPGVRTAGRCNQAGHPTVYPGVEDQVAENRQEPLQTAQRLRAAKALLLRRRVREASVFTP